MHNHIIRKVLLLFLLVLPHVLFAQKKGQERIDSLKSRISFMKEDSLKCLLYNTISYENRVINMEEAVKYGNLTIELSKKLGFRRGIMLGNANLGNAYRADKPQLAIAHYQTAYDMAVKAGRDDLVNRLAYDMGYSYTLLGEADQALRFGKQALDYYISKNAKSTIETIQTYMAQAEMMKGNRKPALQTYLTKLKQFKEDDRSQEHVSTLSSIASIYQSSNDFPSALTYAYKALRLANASDVGSLFICNTLIGNIYAGLDEWKMALDYHVKALKLIEDPKSGASVRNGLVIALMTLAEDYAGLNDFDDALSYSQKALSLIGSADKINDREVRIMILNQIAWTYYKNKDFSKALQYTQRAQALNSNMARTTGRVNTVLGQIYAYAPDSILQQAGIRPADRYNKAAGLLSASVNTPESRQDLNYMRDNYGELAKIYELDKDYVKAYSAYQKFVGFSDSIVKLNNRAELVRRESALQFARKEDSLRYQQQLVSSRLAQQTLLATQQQQALQLNQQQLSITTKQKDIERLNFLRTQAGLQAEQNKRRANMQQLKASAASLQLQKAELDSGRARSRFLTAGIVGLGVVVLSLAFLAWVILRANRQSKRANALLQEQKEQIQITLQELKVTQDQLIQSEKMASLGELTAGIAHEIQNPLNFVNNFSEVSRELLYELKEELSAGNTDDVLAIAGDLDQNLEKIGHHGKRADNIVKGMLQHSRTNPGAKEPTDLNALADECLRLSYHGLRAKDKSFNAELVTEFDPSLPKVDAIPQDLGRVLLNLFNNAFQATAERQRQNHKGYKPKVSVRTRYSGSGAEIRVMDNGPGVDQSIRDKVFQPFFTTKPTGEGTGLGLSLSYDIITKSHHGTIECLPAEDGATFLVRLPGMCT
ncbi:tetratricopeptide repeat protein [Hufsiella ginkgonis]|uniref:histidine kinase n=1 Tax=Hufsiella ginkgonis TaxID=2695274 RepID=A0A7K1XY96_9SPHI|nr:tetratricopeptide repeat protein [Hufsiella ginkgonis]MXV15798.1 tetratricopeptide repeat protein [Hufsiella ginkgonis]